MEAIDLAKGLGILLVVIGHHIGKDSPVGRVLYLFHMPLFFFLSGWTLDDGASAVQTLRRRASGLLKPYLAVWILLLPLELSMGGLAWRDPGGWGLRLIWANGSAIPGRWMPLWFLPALWMTVAVYRTAAVPLLQRLPWAAQGVLMIAVGWAGLHLLRWGGRLPPAEAVPFRSFGHRVVGWPMSLDMAGLTLFFCFCGHRGRNLSDLLHRRAGLLAGFGLAVLSAVALSTGMRFDLNARLCTHGPETLAAALGGIVMTLALAAALCDSRWLRLRSFLILLGRNSLSVLVFHRFFQLNLIHGFHVLLFGIRPLIAAANLAAAVALPLIVHQHLLPRLPGLGAWFPRFHSYRSIARAGARPA